MLNTRRLYLSSLLAHLLPETRGYSLKRKLYRWSGVKVGENVRICSSVKILGNASLSIGDNTWIGPGTFIMCSQNAKVSSEEYILIPPNYLTFNSITPNRYAFRSTIAA